MNERNECMNECIVQRLSRVYQGDTNNCAQEIFFPSLKGNKLNLKGRSIFFEDIENNGKIDSGDEHTKQSQVVIYLSVALALQRAREGGKTIG